MCCTYLEKEQLLTSSLCVFAKGIPFNAWPSMQSL